jgi:DNA-binding MarR family transcriptional regulator
MSAAALQACLARHQAHAALSFRLDEELGTHHGLAWSDFVLLEALDAAGGSLASAALAQRLGLLRSRLLLQLRPLEKTGVLERIDAPDGRRVALRPAGRGLLREARETAGAVCAVAA